MWSIPTTNRRILAFILGLCGLALLGPGETAAQQPPANPAPAQASSTPVDPPLVQANVQTPVIRVTKPKLDHYKGHVLAFNLAAVIVQSDANPKFIWSFQYSPELRTKVIELLNTGGYRNGDRIQVYCHPGTMVAVKFKGRPSGSGSS